MILTLNFKDDETLAMAFMPFVKNGGIFAPTEKNYVLGDEVFIMLNLPGSKEKIAAAGKVIWITPKNAATKKPAGVGLQFDNQDNGATVKIIEAMVGTRHRAMASSMTI